MNVFDLYASLSLNTDNYDSSLSSARNAAESFGQDVAEALEAGVKAYTDLITDSVKAYSNYEETADGIRRIFGDTSEGIIKNSKNAYKTAQISSSEYLANAQILSGALIRTLGDDTEEVTKLIDWAMTDLSDNVNAMGTDMNFVMKAYAGFARQEFRMLDNLYLGYGGTKTEARKMLYAMAEEKDLLEQLGIEFNDLPVIEDFDKDKDFTMLTLDNIIKAIHVRQVQMNIAGTTLEEGATHIQGTIRQTQAAWKDLLKTFAGEKDMGIDEAIQHVYDSVFGEKEGEGLLNVIIPRIAETMEGISKFIVKSAPILAETIPQVIETLKPSLEAAVNSIGELITTILPSVVDLLWPVVSDVMSTLLDLITGKMHESGGIFDLIANVIDFIRQHADDLPGILAAMWGSITALKISHDIMEFITLLTTIFNRATLIVAAIGAIAAVLFLYRGEIMQFFSQIGKYIDLLSLQIENIRDIFEHMDWGALGSFVGTEIILGIVNAINAGIGAIQRALNNIIGSIDLPFFNGKKWLESLNDGEGIVLHEINTENLEKRAEEYKGKILKDDIDYESEYDAIRGLILGDEEDYASTRSQILKETTRERIDRRNAEMDAIQKDIDESSWFDTGDRRSPGQRLSDTFGLATKLLGFNTGLFDSLGVGEMFKTPEPVPDEVPESYENLNDVVTTTVNAFAGAEDAETAGLNPSLEATAEKMTDIIETSEPAASALAESLPEAASTLMNTLSGEADETLDGSLGQINTQLTNIYTNSNNIITLWNGALASAIKTLEKNAELAVKAFQKIQEGASQAAGAVDALAGSIGAVIESIERLNKMEIQMPTISGMSGLEGLDFGSGIPGRASGGPVNEGDVYWVGEEGPELYVPERTGTIVSNNNLNKLGQTVYVNVTFEGEVIGDEDSISGYVTKACNKAITEAVYAGS